MPAAVVLSLSETSTAPHAIRVRRAGPSDAAALGTLHAEATEERLGHRGGSVLMASVGRGRDPVEASKSFALHTEDDQVEVLVADLIPDVPRENGRSDPLGHAVIRFVDSGPVKQRVAVVEELYVTPRGRNVGLGSALLDHARNSAAARGCTGLDAVALPGDRATKNFFEDHAMVARAIIVHSEIEPLPRGTADQES